MNTSTIPQRYLLNIHDFYQVAERHEEKRLELIEGEIIDMGKIGYRHAACVDRLTYLFTSQIGQKAIVRVQNPIHLSDLSEPLPDLCLLHFRQDFYQNNHPTPKAVLLLIEVADSSLKYDKEIKIPLYAFYQIPEVWLVDLNNQCVIVYWQPDSTNRNYLQQQIFQPNQRLTPQALPEIEIAVFNGE